MGLNSMTAEFVISAISAGIKVNSVCTLGRLNLFFPKRRALSLLKQYDLTARNNPSGFEWAEDFFDMLGIDQRASMDFSDYESPTIIHDLNKPIPDSLRNRFDLVLDGGTLEHVFNFPIAIQNAMEMVAPGGHLMLSTPFNNLCGHGFYQFSPELFYRVLSPENGFEIVRMFVYSGSESPYEVRDPAAVGKRVMLINGESTSALIHAIKIESKDVFTVTPQQSDYVELWKSDTSRPEDHDGKLKSFLRNNLTQEQISWVSKKLQPWRQKQDYALDNSPRPES